MMEEGATKPKKFIAYNSGDTFYQKEEILMLVFGFHKTTALQIRYSVVLIMTSKFFVIELNCRCMIIRLKFGNFGLFVYEDIRYKIYKHIFQNYLTKKEPADMAPTTAFPVQDKDPDRSITESILKQQNEVDLHVR